MKGLFGTILTTFLLGMPLTAQSIIMTSPNGGETWPLGTSHDITWSATSYSGTVNLMLFNGGAQVGAIATGLSAATGRYSWTVGQYQGGTVGAGSAYTIRVRSADNSLGDSSDAPFTITQMRQVQQRLHDQLPPVVLKPPRLEVTRIWLVRNNDGFAIVFNYKNTGDAPLPKASAFSTKPSFRVLINGGGIEGGAGSLYIPAFPAPPGWEQVGYAGAQWNFHTWRDLHYDSYLGSYEICCAARGTLSVTIGDNHPLGMASDTLSLNLYKLALSVSYDLFISNISYDWHSHQVTIQAQLNGVIPEGREIEWHYGYTHSGREFSETRKISGRSYTFTRKIDPGDLKQITIGASVIVKMSSLDERCEDIDTRNNSMSRDFSR
jgi:hypothetical protein